MTDLFRFDNDPDALAWARERVGHVVNLLERAALEPAADKRARDLLGYAATAMRTYLIGTPQAMGQFDERLGLGDDERMAARQKIIDSHEFDRAAQAAMGAGGPDG